MKVLLAIINWLIGILPDNLKEKVSDGFHPFSELYDSRLIYNAALFNLLAKKGLYDVHKSFHHHNGEACFGGGWFIVSAMLPTGQISNHYPKKYWKMFKVRPEEKSTHTFDGHDAKDVYERLKETCCAPKVLKFSTTKENIEKANIKSISEVFINKSKFWDMLFAKNHPDIYDLIELKNAKAGVFIGEIITIIDYPSGYKVIFNSLWGKIKDTEVLNYLK